MVSKQPWGATPNEWAHFDLILGYTDKLLPVVCNPEASVSPNSKMKALGKTPSIYNAQRHVVGFSNWTNKVSAGPDIEKWMAEPDYGICIRTGCNEVAIDCDSDDADIQARILSIMLRSFGRIPPRRFRDNSNKCLYLISAEGDYSKRVHRLENNLGIIEFLAKGQQFIAAGTHPSGARIQWDGGLPPEPFSITGHQLDTFWDMLACELPVASSTVAGGIGKARDLSVVTPNATDEVAEFLDSNGLTLDFGRNGERYITCPFENGHSTDSGITSTAYFPKNTAGYEMGHFKCLHASCAHRNDGDFLNEIGFGVGDFEDLTTVGDTHQDSDSMACFTDLSIDMTSHFLERFIYVLKGDQVCDLSRPPYSCMMEMKSFKNLMAPYQFPPESKKGNPVPATKRWIEHPKKQVAENTGYQPGKGRLIKRPDGRFDINEFYLPEHPKVSDFEKSNNIFLKHMEYLLPKKEQREFFIARLAWMLQRPERRCPITMLHISTLHGTGRGWLIQLMEKILGHWNCTRAKMDVICKNQYHDYLHHSLLCTVDEVRENTDKRYSISDQLRDILTEPRFEVNNKYGKKVTEDIFTSFLFLSNHIDAIIIPEEDRRIAVFGGPEYLQDARYYERIYLALSDSDFVAQVFWYLKAIDLNRFNWQRAPDSEERRIMIESGRSEVAKSLHDLIEAPITSVMTYQQIVSFIINEVGLEAEINSKQITAILRAKGLTQYEKLKFKGDTVRPWLLVKNCKLTKEEVRAELETCEKLQNQV